MVTTIPFVKNNEFDYSWLVPFAKGKTKQLLGWLVFMAMVIFVVVAVSNGVNLTDGLDGLAGLIRNGQTERAAVHHALARHDGMLGDHETRIGVLEQKGK